MKTLTLLAVLAALTTVAEARKRGNNNAAAKAKQEQMEKERAEKEKRRQNYNAFMKLRDTNHDGSLTKEEYLSGETNKAEGEKKFEEHDKNKDRDLTKGEIEDLIGL